MSSQWWYSEHVAILEPPSQFVDENDNYDDHQCPMQGDRQGDEVVHLLGGTILPSLPIVAIGVARLSL